MAKKKKPAAPLSISKLSLLVRRWERKADKALSAYVRELIKRTVGHCVFCPGPVDHCFHFVSRKRRVLRWRLINVTGSCKVCNKLEKFFPDVSRAWFIRRYGVEVYLDLVRVGQKEWKARSNMDRVEMEASIRYLQAVTKHYQMKFAGLVRID